MVDLRTLGWVFLIVPFFRPAEYILGSTGVLIFRIWFFLALAVVLLIVLRESIRVEPWLFLLITSYVLVCLGSLVSPGEHNYSGLINMTVRVLGFAFLAAAALQIDQASFMRAISLVGIAYITINAASIFLFKSAGGMYHPSADSAFQTFSPNYYFFGYDTITMYSILPLLCGIGLDEINRKGRLGLWTGYAWIISFSSNCYAGTATSIVVLLVLPILFLVFSRRPAVGVTVRAAIVFLVLAVISIIVFKVYMAFGWIIQDVLGKDLTLTGRVSIWDAAIKEIIDSNLMGLGYFTDAYSYQVLGHSHAHNIILELLFEGGLLCLISYLLAILFAGRGGSYKEDGLSWSFLISVLYSYFILCLFDFYIDCAAPMLIVALIAASAKANDRLPLSLSKG